MKYCLCQTIKDNENIHCNDVRLHTYLPFPETNAKHHNSGQLHRIHLFLANPSSSVLAFVCLSSPTDIHTILTLTSYSLSPSRSYIQSPSSHTYLKPVITFKFIFLFWRIYFKSTNSALQNATFHTEGILILVDSSCHLKKMYTWGCRIWHH